MKGNWFFDKNFNAVPDEVLDNVGEFFDFPLDDIEIDPVMEADWNAQFKHLEEPSLGVFPVSSSIQTQIENPELGRTFPPASVAKTAAPTCGKMIPIHNISSNGMNLQKPQTYSPVSVFENSSSSSVENSIFELLVIPTKRPRSKRRRLSNISKLFPIPFISASPAAQKHQRKADSHSVLRKTQPAGKPMRKSKRKERKKGPSLPTDKVEKKRPSSKKSVVSRKCSHCEVTETPQWREGPMGPKTLCNACGVRFRSGRLFPEYRPAASPTFVAALHSNSHKRVLEMRNRANQNS